MPGVLSHLTAALIGFWIVFFIFKKNKNKLFYSFAFVFGTIIPDAIKFGIPGIKLETASYYKILQDPLFSLLDSYTHIWITWFVLGIIVLVISLIIYKLDWIKNKTFKKINIGYLIFFIAIIIHLIMDFYIKEKSYWI